MGPGGNTLGQCTAGPVRVKGTEITRVEIDRVENGFVVMIRNSKMQNKNFIAENLNRAFSIVEKENAILKQEIEVEMDERAKEAS
jgi:hypothetical protein